MDLRYRIVISLKYPYVVKFVVTWVRILTATITIRHTAASPTGLHVQPHTSSSSIHPQTTQTVTMAEGRSKIKPDAHLVIDQPTLKLPYELLRKNFKTAQTAVERDSTTVKDGLKKAANAAVTQSSSPDEILKNLDSMVARMQGLKRKLEACAEEDERLREHSLARIEHLSELYTIPSLDDVKYERWSRVRLNRLLGDYLLRNGYCKSAAALAEAKGIEKLLDMTAFLRMNDVKESLRERRFTEALAWCAENKKELRKADVSTPKYVLIKRDGWTLTITTEQIRIHAPNPTIRRDHANSRHRQDRTRGNSAHEEIHYAPQGQIPGRDEAFGWPTRIPTRYSGWGLQGLWQNLLPGCTAANPHQGYVQPGSMDGFANPVPADTQLHPFHSFEAAFAHRFSRRVICLKDASLLFQTHRRRWSILLAPHFSFQLSDLQPRTQPARRPRSVRTSYQFPCRS